MGAENLRHQAIFADDATGAVTPPHLELIQIGDGIWQGTHRRGLVQGAVRPVGDVEVLLLAQHAPLGDVEGVEGGRLPVGPALAASARRVQAHDRPFVLVDQPAENVVTSYSRRRRVTDRGQ